jgi:PAS domain S-box-containing protein
MPSTPANLSRLLPSRREAVHIAVIAVAYFLANKLALFFPDGEEILAAIWPAAGIGLVALLRHPRRLWPAILAAIFLAGNAANLLSGRPLANSVGFMAANVLESSLCAWLITQWCGPSPRFSRVREIGALVVAASLVNAGSALVGAATAKFAGIASYWHFWRTWMVADGLGILLVAPCLTAWLDFRPAKPGTRRDHGLESLLFLGLWTLLSWLSFHPPVRPPLLPQPYMLVALLAWPALRLGQRPLTLGLLVLAGMAVSSPLKSFDFLTQTNTDAVERLLTLQIFLGVTAVTSFLMAAVTWEGKRSGEGLRLATERLHLALSASKMGVWDWNPASGQVVVTPGYFALLGYGPAEALPGEAALSRFVHPEDAARVARRFEEGLASGEARFGETFRMLDRQGATVWIARTCQVADRDELGRPRRVIGIDSDVSERKREEQFRYDVDRIIRHDIKAPLHGLFNVAGLALQEGGSDVLNQLYPQIKRGIRQVIHLVDAADALHLMEQGRYSPAGEPIHLPRLLAGIAQTLDSLARQYRVAVVVSQAGQALSDAPSFFGEAYLIENMLTNLVKNAIEAAPPGSDVTIGWSGRNGERRIAIHNQGAIPASVRDRFFEKYVSCGKSQGKGLGTYSARLIAQAHGGRIDFATGETEGTTVTVIFPTGAASRPDTPSA